MGGESFQLADALDYIRNGFGIRRYLYFKVGLMLEKH